MKQGKILVGYTINGAAYKTVDLKPNEEICRQCEGSGRLDFIANYGRFERRESCECENCDGEGIIISEQEEM
jgi:DnaJ-class molecular chaperone